MLKTNSIDLTKLYNIQKDLDAYIAKNHNVNYEITHKKRLLALIIELGEFANETRCFKYWSNKGPSSKDIILDEYADGLHFLLSLGIPLNTNKYIYDIYQDNNDLTDAFLKLYEDALKLNKEYNLTNYINAMQSFINLLPLLGYSENDLISAYLKKAQVNYDRQNSNY